MLEKLLDLITQAGIYKTSELARRLDTSPELIELALEMLRQRGYLKAMEGCGATKCGSCGVSKGCNEQKARLWVRSKKI